MLADNGFFSEANVKACAAAGIEPLIAMNRDSHHSLMPSGTARFSGPCHPALSSCRTIRLFSPAPADLAKSKRMSSNNSLSGALPHGALLERLQTAFETFHTVAPVAGSNKTPDVEPFVAVMAKRDRPLTPWCPYPSQDRLQANPVFVHRPELDGSLRMLLLFFSGGVLQFFLAPRDPLRPRHRDGVALVSGWNIRWRPAHPSHADRVRI